MPIEICETYSYIIQNEENQMKICHENAHA